MDDDHRFDDGVVAKLFENGLMGVEADPEFGGSGCNFLTMMLVCEELSKVRFSEKNSDRYLFHPLPGRSIGRRPR